jgi:hypothetical protein
MSKYEENKRKFQTTTERNNKRKERTTLNIYPRSVFVCPSRILQGYSSSFGINKGTRIFRTLSREN